jgi:hypothetical protein
MYMTLDVHITLLRLLRGWKHKNQEDTKSPQRDDTKSSQKKTWLEHGQENQGLERGQKPKA